MAETILKLAAKVFSSGLPDEGYLTHFCAENNRCLNMIVRKLNYTSGESLSLSAFRDMDYYAVEQYNLPIELMMENAGLQLATLIAGKFPDTSTKVFIGIGNGNNGGGGLVAARRLAAWGYQVSLSAFTNIDKTLPAAQLERAIRFGCKEELPSRPDVWVDAYLGFSQRLPLSEKLMVAIDKANESSAYRISLDIPTGFLGDPKVYYFKADAVMTLAAPKTILETLPASTELFLGDLGIPGDVYQKFGMIIPPFHQGQLLQLLKTEV